MFLEIPHHNSANCPQITTALSVVSVMKKTGKVSTSLPCVWAVAEEGYNTQRLTAVGIT